MATYALPIFYTLVLWWLSTGVILYLDRLDRRTFIWSMAGATALLAISLWGVASTSVSADASGAYLAFACGLLVWGWQLVSFYMGYLTGPRKTACDPGCTGWRRFVEAVRTSLYHELAVCAFGVVLLALTWGRPNRMALWTFLVLWWMHQSAKLNVYFGVPNLGIAPRSFALFAQLHGAETDESFVSCFGDRLDHRDGRAGSKSGLAGRELIRSCGIHDAGDIDGAGGPGALVLGDAVASQCALAMGHQPGAEWRSH
jgi:hypothetical protein